MSKYAGIWRDYYADPPEPLRNGRPYLIVVRYFRVAGVYSSTMITPNQLADRARCDVETTYEWLDDSNAGLYDEVIRFLNKFVQMHESGLLPNKFTYQDAVKALEKLQPQQ